MAVAKNRKNNNEEIILSSPYELFEKAMGFPDLSKVTPAEFHQAKIKFAKKLQDQALEEKVPLSKLDKDLLERLLRADLEEIKFKEAKANTIKLRLEKSGYTVKKVAGDWEAAELIYDNNVIINYTNVILSEDRVIMPDYKSLIIDKYAREFYKDLGYKPISFDAIYETIDQAGGVRCTTETYRCPTPFIDN
jgi:hypothetical protein